MNDSIFSLPALRYDYDQLGPYISKDVMILHHTKHHQTYVDKFNAIVAANDSLKGRELKDLMQNVSSLDDSIKQSVINMGGGHYNHSLFWEFMSPKGGGEPTGELKDALLAKYGSFQAFVDEFNAKALGVFGSGWAWLQPDMSIVTTSNQDNPIMKGQSDSILGLDVWEHAYYLDYKNKRDDYVKSWWNVVDWQTVADRYQSIK